MFQEISYAGVLGFPLIMWLGIMTLILLISVATMGYLIHHGSKRVKFSWHKYLAFTLIIIAIIHGTMGIMLYF